MSPVRGKKIKVVVADDSVFIRTAIKKMLEADPQIVVVGSASDGQKAIDLVKKHNPDVLTLDIEMPRMGGLEALKIVMQDHPLPVLMISSLTASGARATIEALTLGALDYIPKQVANSSLDILRIQRELHSKVKAVAKHQFPRRKYRRVEKPIDDEKSKPIRQVRRRPLATAAQTTNIQPRRHIRPRSDIEIVAIGTSTGGPKALQEILPLLSADFPTGILVVQHMPPYFTKSLADRLNTLSNVTVKEAEDGDEIRPGLVLIAPGGQHMSVRKIGYKRKIVLSEEPSELLHKPSVDVMMLSIAELYGDRSIGVVLTGMGQDGLKGMLAIREKNGITIAQDEESSIIYGMPKACAEHGAADKIVSLTRVASTLEYLIRKVSKD